MMHLIQTQARRFVGVRAHHTHAHTSTEYMNKTNKTVNPHQTHFGLSSPLWSLNLKCQQKRN